jgi:hypothetical protein
MKAGFMGLIFKPTSMIYGLVGFEANMGSAKTHFV